METVKQKGNKRTIAIIAGVLFVLLCLDDIRILFSYILGTAGDGFSFSWTSTINLVSYSAVKLLGVIAYVIFAVALFGGKNKFLLLVAANINLASCYVNFLNYGVRAFISPVAYVILLSGLTLFVFIFLNSVSSSKKVASALKRLWFIPAIFSLLRYGHAIFLYVSIFLSSFGSPNVTYFIFNDVEVSAPVYCFFLVTPYVVVGSITAAAQGLLCFGLSHSTEFVSGPQLSQSDRSGYMNLGMHAVLWLFSAGIWQYVWIYKTTKHLNNCQGEKDRNPVTKLLLCMFVPFYYLYWICKSAQRIQKKSAEKGVYCESSGLYLLLGFFVNVAAVILMQNRVNKLATATAMGSSEPAEQPQEA